MANRQERIQYAETLILRDPTTSKRVLQTELKTEYGVGLSDTMRRTLLQKANTPAVLRSRIQTGAFTSNERKILRDFIKRGNPPYIKDVINDRYLKAKDAIAKGKTLQQFRRDVRNDAKGRGWIIRKHTDKTKRFPARRKGQIDILAMIRDYRDKYIDKGEYIIPKGMKPKTDKSKIKAQKGQFSERQAARERVRLKAWIAQVNAAIYRSKGDKMRQLQQQKASLERRLGNIK